MKFNNKENKSYNIDGETIWYSRSVTVVGIIILINNNITYVLASKRVPNALGNQGKMNLVTGYLDWNESGTEAVYRECWEETGFNLPKYMKEFNIKKNDLNDPWTVSTDPNELRIS
jgi:8-oxo-dGTP pyrophosphatase MutT (NUDIX family)